METIICWLQAESDWFLQFCNKKRVEINMLLKANSLYYTSFWLYSIDFLKLSWRTNAAWLASQWNLFYQYTKWSKEIFVCNNGLSPTFNSYEENISNWHSPFRILYCCETCFIKFPQQLEAWHMQIN